MGPPSFVRLATVATSSLATPRDPSGHHPTNRRRTVPPAHPRSSWDDRPSKLLLSSRPLGRSGGMADAADSKSAVREGVRVRVPPSAHRFRTRRGSIPGAFDALGRRHAAGGPANGANGTNGAGDAGWTMWAGGPSFGRRSAGFAVSREVLAGISGKNDRGGVGPASSFEARRRAGSSAPPHWKNETNDCRPPF